MTNTEFLEELKDFINENRKMISNIECSNHSDQVDTDKVNNVKQILDKLEQDYFGIHPSTNLDNVKKFNEDGNLIKEENGTIDQVEKGLLKIFNGLIESGEYSIGNYDFDNEKYSTSICQIADRLLQIESDRKLREEYYKI